MPDDRVARALRAQPRRADARQAERRRARRRSSRASAPIQDMQLYGRGLRRRLPTMLDGDERAIRMVYSLAFSLPGTPVLFYGEEIGMAENLDIEGRYSVRSPMQWSPGRRRLLDGRPARLRRPLVDGRVRARARQRRRAAARPALAAELVRAPDPPPPRVPGARLRHARAARDRRAVRARPPLRLGGRDDRRGARARAAARSTVELPVEDGEALVDLFDDAEHPLPASCRSSRTPRTGSASAAPAAACRRDLKNLKGLALYLSRRPLSCSSWRRSRLVGRALRSTPWGRVIFISATRRSRSAMLSSVSV